MFVKVSVMCTPGLCTAPFITIPKSKALTSNIEKENTECKVGDITRMIGTNLNFCLVDL